MESGNYAYVIRCKGMLEKSKLPQFDLSSGAILPLVEATISSELLGFMLCSSRVLYKQRPVWPYTNVAIFCRYATCRVPVWCSLLQLP